MSLLFSTNADWVQSAACASLPVEVADDFFFGKGKVRQDKAAALCRVCPVANECLTDALRHEREHQGTPGGEPYGVFGGVSGNQRKVIRRRNSA